MVKHNYSALTLINLLMIMSTLMITSIFAVASLKTAINALDTQGKIILKNAVYTIEEKIIETQKLVESGIINEAEAQMQVLAYIKNQKSIDLGKNGYFIILDSKGKVLIHPTLEGENVYELYDYSNPPKPFVKEEIQTAKEGGGFTYFKWKYPNSDKIGQKVVYGNYFEDWDWIIQSSSYISDYEALAWLTLAKIIIPIGFALCFVILLTIRLVKFIGKPIKVLLNGMTLIMDQQYTLIPESHMCSEFTMLLQGFNAMVNQLKHNFIELTEKNTELENNVIEIQALYEEMYASEEMLRGNYDELEAYRKVIEMDKAHYQTVLSLSDDIFIEYNPVKDNIFLNDLISKKQEYGISFSEFLELFHFEDCDKIKFLFEKVIDKSVNRALEFVRFKVQDNHYKWHRILLVSYCDQLKKESSYIGVIKDVHNEYLQQERTEFYAFHDMMTGLYNKEYLYEKIRQQVSECSTEGKYLIALDISNFERIKDLYGDNLLNIVIFIVGAVIKDLYNGFTDISVVGFGKYALLINENEMKDLPSTLRCLEEKTKLLNVSNKINIPLNMTCGCVSIEKYKNESMALLDYAQAACRFSERNNQYYVLNWFDEELRRMNYRNSLMEQYLKDAIRRQQLFLVYQPQFTAKNPLKPVGYEALIRWNDSVLGMVGPDEFIPLAEEIDFIYDIGRFVITEVTRFIGMLNAQNYHIEVAINASFKELLRADYVDFLIQCCKDNQVSHNQIKIEITETEAAQYIDSVINNLEKLQSNQFEIHMDDFGTGYSSLNQLGRLPISVVKIDKSFVERIETDQKMLTLTTMIMDIAHKFGMKVIAEGIESERQLAILEERGCDYYQGYYFSKPITKEQVIKLAGQ